MKALVKAHLFHPSVVLPLAAFTELLVERDFNLGQVGIIVAARSAQAVVSRSRSLLCCHGCHPVC
ncbi:MULTISPECIES: hypothetical protein [Burkholderiaceae]|uniref:Uncharacterized protein n=1 Tax=Paraburkholderia phytofirmans (strain DSM 17436 / LMG 22146 / PsJN) TaxID=398527 RepID=B2SZZ3_PARPJ|nr:MULTISPECIES: hypothetical protein [Burkholderiaceae]UTP22244.1 hypothetical protein NMB33_18350 [Burkholderia sp. FXe9]ACD14554.1 conserved hypothetical protein [Paraburkholderia phytofirmans PsJN]MBA9949176.1 hypothetical protein [Burkholderia cepacia]MBA9979470.1 hypothetical protein [Burkholderia cepacia]MBA9998319.1 hypothetical protein [Burkholderia cepacia]